MARYEPQDHNSLLLPVVLAEQIIPGSFAFVADPMHPLALFKQIGPSVSPQHRIQRTGSIFDLLRYPLFL